MNIFFKKTISTLVLLISLVSFPVFSETKILMETSEGNIILNLDETKAPITVNNFITYAQEGFYNGTIFHRVIKDFMIQGGGFDENMLQKPTKKEIVNEGANGLLNKRGSIAMARRADPNSATAQFFINHADNAFLNARPNQAGYAVFGQVSEGMEVVDKIAKQATHTRGGFQNVPMKVISINKVSVIENNKN